MFFSFQTVLARQPFIDTMRWNKTGTCVAINQGVDPDCSGNIQTPLGQGMILIQELNLNPVSGINQVISELELHSPRCTSGGVGVATDMTAYLLNDADYTNFENNGNSVISSRATSTVQSWDCPGYDIDADYATSTWVFTPNYDVNTEGAISYWILEGVKAGGAEPLQPIGQGLYNDSAFSWQWDGRRRV